MRREPSFDPAWNSAAEIRPLLRARPYARLRFGARFVIAAALIAGLTVAARDKLRSSPVSSTWAEPPDARPAERARATATTDAAGPSLRLELGANDGLVRSEPARWNPATGLREDALSAGTFAAIEAPFLRVVVGEAPTGADASASLFVALARRAAEVAGLAVIRTGMRGRVESRFGPVETVEAVLAGEGGRTCTGFQSLGTPHLRVEGWLCGILGQAPEPREVSCLIDRLQLAGRAAPTVEAAFAEAEPRRGARCAAGDASVPTTDRTGSIGAPRQPPKRRARKNAAGIRQSSQAGL